MAERSRLFFTIDLGAGKLVLNTTTLGTTRLTAMLILTFALATASPARPRSSPPRSEPGLHPRSRARPGGRRADHHLPPPRLVDGQRADAERAASRNSPVPIGRFDDLLRDSVTAPFIIKVHDVKATGATVRQADLWFAVHGDLEKIDPAQEARRTDQKAVEVANMWFQTRLLKAEEIRAAGVKAGDTRIRQERWYAHVHAKLLDRIDFEVTNHVVASQSAESIVIASATDPSFVNAGPLSNGWKALYRDRRSQPTTRRQQPYAGGISYAKISRIAFQPSCALRGNARRVC